MEVDQAYGRSSPQGEPQPVRMASLSRARTMLRMTKARVTEIAPQLEPVTQDSFMYVAITDRPSESTAARIAELFGTEPQRAIVD